MLSILALYAHVGMGVEIGLAPLSSNKSCPEANQRGEKPT